MLHVHANLLKCRSRARRNPLSLLFIRENFFLRWNMRRCLGLCRLLVRVRSTCTRRSAIMIFCVDLSVDDGARLGIGDARSICSSYKQFCENVVRNILKDVPHTRLPTGGTETKRMIRTAPATCFQEVLDGACLHAIREKRLRRSRLRVRSLERIFRGCFRGQSHLGFHRVQTLSSCSRWGSRVHSLLYILRKNLIK